MKSESKEFLYRLLLTPSPSGYEIPIQDVVREEMANYADLVETDIHGNVIVGINTDAERKVMLSGHCDQIGFIVRSISSKGYIYLNEIGGIDAGVLEGARVTIHSKKGRVEGVFGRKAIHLQTAAERRGGEVKLSRLWVDIGAKDEKQAAKLVEIGDPVTFKLEVTELENSLISSPGLDDKAGLFSIMETIKALSKSKAKLNVGVYAVSTVAEEMGLRGAISSAYNLNPEVGIAVDVNFASDCPGVGDPNCHKMLPGKGAGIERGPFTNPVVYEMLIKSAKKIKLPHQIFPSHGRGGTDAVAIQVSRGGVASANVAIPLRNMHTQVEVISLKDLESTSKLLTQFVKDIKPSTSFIPGA